MIAVAMDRQVFFAILGSSEYISTMLGLKAKVRMDSRRSDVG